MKKHLALNRKLSHHDLCAVFWLQIPISMIRPSSKQAMFTLCLQDNGMERCKICTGYIQVHARNAAAGAIFDLQQDRFFSAFDSVQYLQHSVYVFTLLDHFCNAPCLYPVKWNCPTAQPTITIFFLCFWLTLLVLQAREYYFFNECSFRTNMN